jgi:acyl carrier protein
MSREDLITEVGALVLRVIPDIPLTRITAETALTDLGVASLKLINVLVAIQAQYGFEWSDDVDPEVFATVGSLASHVAAETAGGE